MYLAPLNYDRFFRKVFSDPEISRKFLEDFLETEIESIEILKEKHAVTDDAAFVEFDFRCRMQGGYVIIDMQQWYKPDVSQRFYLYHALNTGLQLESLPKRRISLDRTSKKIVKVKDYRALEPVLTLIWMVDDSMKFDSDYAAFRMTPETVTDFIRNEKLWNTPEIREIMKQRAQVLRIMSNKTKNLDFLPMNRLVFAFQKNIVKNRKTEKYAKWFEFAERTRNTDNRPGDFEEFSGTEPFDEMMRRLDRTVLTDDDVEYIEREKEGWEEEARFFAEYFDEGFREGKEAGREEGREEGFKEGDIKGRIEAYTRLLENPMISRELAEQIKQQIAELDGKLKKIAE